MTVFINVNLKSLTETVSGQRYVQMYFISCLHLTHYLIPPSSSEFGFLIRLTV